MTDERANGTASAGERQEQAGVPPQLSDDEIALLESFFDMAREGRTAELAAAVDAGIPVNLTNAKGDTLLMLAAYNRHAETVRMLLERGADTNRINDRGHTAMSCAVFRSDETIARDLLGAGADPDLGANTALEIARQFTLPDMVRLFEAHAALHEDDTAGVSGSDGDTAG